MQLDPIRKSIQPKLDQDFDALYEEFVADTGSEDIGAFLDHLVDFGLIDQEVVEALVAEESEPASTDGIQPIDWGSDDEANDEESTVLASKDDLISLSQVAATSSPDLQAIPPPSPQAEPVMPDREPPRSEEPPAVQEEPPAVQEEPPAMQEASLPESPPVLEEEPPPYEDAPTGVGAPQRMELIDFRRDEEDNDTLRKRTQFRRKNGQLEETGAFGRPSPRERRRRRVEPTPRDMGHYDFVGNVGEGAMGTVHLVKDQKLHRKIAYKEMSEEIASQPALASKFLAEAQITAQLEHPNIVPVYALEGQNAYTMKLIRGRTLEDLINETRDRIQRRVALDEDHTLEGRLDLFLKVCDAMAFSHARGVVHRDLKPENIMVGEFGEVYVMDWGIAHLLPGDHDEHPHVEGLLDEGDLIIGTAGYMSPEQADGKTAELTGASDQYALGLILHELVGLKPAVTGKNQLHIMTRQQLGEVNRLVHCANRPIAPELIAIVQKSTTFEPAQRYRSVDDFADDIRRFLRGEAVFAKPDNPWQALVRFTGRHRQATLLAGMSVIFGSMLLVLLLGVYTQVSASRAAAREQALSNLVTVAGRHAAAVEGQLVRLEGLLLILATTSEDMLTMGDPSPKTIYTTEVFDASEVPGSVTGPVYGAPVSLDTSAFHLPPAVDPDAPDAPVRKLEPMNRHFRKVMLRSHSEEAATYTPRRAIRALTEVGVPIRWAYVATEAGDYDVYPGHGGYPASFDPRKTDWYARAASAKGPIWGAPAVDEDLPGGALVVPCTMPLRNEAGDLLGVAGIDVGFDYLARDLLVPEVFRGSVARLAIVDQEGQVLVDPANPSASQPTTFPVPAVVEAMKARRSGALEIDDEIVVYTRMASMDWYFVLSGPTETLLDEVR